MFRTSFKIKATQIYNISFCRRPTGHSRSCSGALTNVEIAAAIFCDFRLDIRTWIIRLTFIFPFYFYLRDRRMFRFEIIFAFYLKFTYDIFYFHKKFFLIDFLNYIIFWKMEIFQVASLYDLCGISLLPH